MASRAGGRRPHPIWGEPRAGLVRRLLDRARASLVKDRGSAETGLSALPLTLRRGPHAEHYLQAERASDHAGAAEAAVAAMEQAAGIEEWWQADIWGHRALWHFERGGLDLEAVRQARRIGDLRAAAGDPDSARRYYAEAIGEARDLGAEEEQGIATLGLGRALMELGRVTEARRMASAAIDLLDRAGGAAAQLADARRLLGEEVPVGETGGSS